MTKLSHTAPSDEQGICVTCGFCCDGTLFLHAHLNPGERGHLPEKIELSSYSENGSDYFRLPCGYFDRKCSIYLQMKADVCSGYRCQLLKDYAEGKIMLQDALETVQMTVQVRKEILEVSRKVTREEKMVFRQLLSWLGKAQQSSEEGMKMSDDLEMLLIRCNIFEALLIKHFRSAEDFNKMICLNEMKRT